EELRLRRHADSLLAVHARDSLMRLARYEQQRDQIKHLLFVHEADSTIDEPVPFNYEEYARRPYEDLGAWKLYFIESFGTDSLMLDSVGIDSLRLDSLRV